MKTSIKTSNGFEFFFNKEDALANAIGKVVMPATYSNYYDKAILNDANVVYLEGTTEAAIASGECDYYGYVLVDEPTCIYCKSPDCVAIVYGESVCGPV